MVATKRRRRADAEDEAPTHMQDLIVRLQKRLGEDAVGLEDEDTYSKVTEYISTQCFGLDNAMHLPGMPVGRIWSIRGDFMSGKSTIAAHIMAETQKMGGFVAYIDTEYAFDEKRARAIGISLEPDKWLLLQPETVEECIGAIRELVKTAQEMQDAGHDRLVTIVWDSIGATATEAELTEEFGASRPGLHARLISAALRQLTPQIAKYRISLGLLNQEKQKMDFFSMGKGDATTMTAEKPIMFHSTIVLRPKHIKKLQNSKKEFIGIRVRCEVRKNKLGAPFDVVEFDIMFADGIDNPGSVLSVALKYGIVKKKAAWYVYGEESFHASDFGDLMTEHPEIMEQILAKMESGVASNKVSEGKDDEEEAEEEDE